MPPESVSLSAATDVYNRHRGHLFSVAYSMLGTVADTEDVLQETWLSWASANRADVANERAYLVRIVMNAALAKLKQAQAERAAYVGPWLPEPLVASMPTEEGSDRVEVTESVSIAMMVVLETLSPLERAVFVLDEAFDYSHREIAAIIDRSPEAVRQLASRARQHMRERRPRYRADTALQRQVTERFLAAAAGGDVASLISVLAPDVAFWSDGGGKRRAALNVIHGPEKVTRFIAGVTGEFADATFTLAYVNGDVGLVLSDGREIIAVGVADISPDGQVLGLYGILNPDKLPDRPLDDRPAEF